MAARQAQPPHRLLGSSKQTNRENTFQTYFFGDDQTGDPSRASG
jgi:hypothetical protein